MAAGGTLADGSALDDPGSPRFDSGLLARPFDPPILRRASVPRTSLLRRLEREQDRPLILLAAPAGYGKTTLLSQWVAKRGRPCAWVTLNHRDGDQRLLEGSIASALAGAGIAPGLTSASFSLVLDDAHVVPDEVLEGAVAWVLDWLGPGCQLALGARREPQLGLARRRAERMVTEIRAAELAFSHHEAARLLREAGVDPTGAAPGVLVERSEGWPAALALAALAQPRLSELRQPPHELRGDNYLIAEYFRAEVLEALQPETIDFLMQTSVCERLSGGLCDDVLGRIGSASVLADLQRSNVPLQPLDPSHEWYRLHGLFREMLQTELRRSEPDAVAPLHRRASEWFETSGDMDRAIDHARSSGDLDRFGELLWGRLPGYLGAGRNPMVQVWLRDLTTERDEGSATLAVAAAHSWLAQGNVAIAEQWARSAAAVSVEASGSGAQQEHAGVKMVHAWVARPGTNGMRELGAHAYRLLRDDSPWRALCCFLRGSADLLAGNDASAAVMLEEGAARGAAVAPDAAALCLAQLGVLATECDDLVIASDFASRARAVAIENQVTATLGAALVSAVFAAAAMREGRSDEAKAAVSESAGLLDGFLDPPAWYAAETRTLLARTTLALGDVAGARTMLAEASRLARRVLDASVFTRWFDEAWDEFDRHAEGALRGTASLTTAELRVLRFLPTHYSFHEIAERLHVSPNTVKTHAHAVYRKLGASSRSEAVEHAVGAGLLGG
jgi:LuxR family transcriptional regulator, maltose regulon positive regulatory protein